MDGGDELTMVYKNVNDQRMMAKGNLRRIEDGYEFIFMFVTNGGKERLDLILLET